VSGTFKKQKGHFVRVENTMDFIEGVSKVYVLKLPFLIFFCNTLSSLCVQIPSFLAIDTRLPLMKKLAKQVDSLITVVGISIIFYTNIVSA
jgi:hypothetical protein